MSPYAPVGTRSGSAAASWAAAGSRQQHLSIQMAHNNLIVLFCFLRKCWGFFLHHCLFYSTSGSGSSSSWWWWRRVDCNSDAGIFFQTARGFCFYAQNYLVISKIHVFNTVFFPHSNKKKITPSCFCFDFISNRSKLHLPFLSHLWLWSVITK